MTVPPDPIPSSLLRQEGPQQEKDRRLEWFLRAHPSEVIEAYAEDGSLHEAIAAAIEKVEDDWIRIAAQNAKDAQARIDVLEGSIDYLRHLIDHPVT